MSIPMPFYIGSAKSATAIGKGCGIVLSQGANKEMIATVATSGLIHGITAIAATGANELITYYKVGGMGEAQIAAAVSNLQLPLMVTTDGKLTPVTAIKDGCVFLPTETATTAGSFIQGYVIAALYAGA